MKKVYLFLLLLAPICLQARDYREKYAGVISHYNHHKRDSLKLRAAIFLIDHMDGHHYPDGMPMCKFTEALCLLDENASMNDLYAAWNDASETGTVAYRPDSCIVSDSMLISNIDNAFDAWESAPWHCQISFRQFCDYILPYRVKDEQMCTTNWRKILKEKYQPLINGVTDMNKAFAFISNHILKTIKSSANYTPYTFNVLLCDKIRKATCDERSVLQICVLRALGIPAVLDIVPIWADYSTRGHSWVSLVLADNSTYTFNENDTITTQFNRNDAQFKQRYRPRPSDYCPYTIKTEKRPSKIYRLGYRKTHEVTSITPHFLSDPFALDVSDSYGLNARVKIPYDGKDTVYLCTFLTGTDWIPIAETTPHGGYAVFDHVGSEIVCLPVTRNGNMRTALTAPFIVGRDSITEYLTPDFSSTHDITITRKYPLYPYISDQWGFMKGAVFEGSNKVDFSQCDTLAVIKTMPYAYTDIPVNCNKTYRYIRYKSQSYSRISLAELAFCSLGKDGGMEKLEGMDISEGVDNSTVKNLYDRNMATTVSTRTVGYWVGLDLGKDKERKISKIEFMPNSDTNFIEPEDLYELYFFDRRWQLLGRKLAKTHQLTFTNVPQGALLLLKDRTKGSEERIFVYNNNQIWY